MKQALRLILIVLFGTAVGFVNGFLGGGGGILVVTVLLWLFALPQKNAQATALWVIFPTTLFSAAVYLIEGNGDWEKILYCTLGVVIGGCVGAVLLGKLKGNVVKFIFSLILVAAGVRMFL